jgi:hypothetical protein
LDAGGVGVVVLAGGRGRKLRCVVVINFWQEHIARLGSHFKDTLPSNVI